MTPPRPAPGSGGGKVYSDVTLSGASDTPGFTKGLAFAPDGFTLYGVTDSEERAALLNLARQANTPGWWHAYADILPSWLEPFVGLEAAASVIRTYQIQLVPGLLQTEGYARALIEQGSAANEDQVARRIELRVSRQEILSGPNPPQLWAVVDEGALRRPVDQQRGNPQSGHQQAEEVDQQRQADGAEDHSSPRSR